MKEVVKTINTVAVILFILICTCLVNGTQVKAAEPTPETVINMAQVIDYVANDDSLYLFFDDGTGYYLENTIDKEEITITAEYTEPILRESYNNYIDMCQVVGFIVNDGNLLIYLNDGTNYYWER